MISTSFSPQVAEMTEMQERPMRVSIRAESGDLNGGNDGTGQKAETSKLKAECFRAEAQRGGTGERL